MLQLSDEELAIAYSGAIVLSYPSKYEGFGLPILEAMACGCPVITCENASIPEVAGEAAININDNDPEELANALSEVQKPGIRQLLIARGIEQAKKFTWSSTAKTVTKVLIFRCLFIEIEMFTNKQIYLDLNTSLCITHTCCGIPTDMICFPDASRLCFVSGCSHC